MVKWIIAGIVAVIVIAGGGYLIAHNSKSPSYSTSSGSNYPSGSSSQPSTSSSTTTSGNIVQIKTSNGTQYLADASGKPLYTYGADTSGVSNCSGSCIAVWPVYGPGSSTPSTLPANVTVISRSGGTKQYAYKGLPLYTFASDSVGGNPTGDNVSDFHLAKP